MAHPQPLGENGSFSWKGFKWRCLKQVFKLLLQFYFMTMIHCICKLFNLQKRSPGHYSSLLDGFLNCLTFGVWALGQSLEWMDTSGGITKQNLMHIRMKLYSIFSGMECNGFVVFTSDYLSFDEKMYRDIQWLICNITSLKQVILLMTFLNFEFV